MQIRQHPARAWLDSLDSTDSLRDILQHEDELYYIIQEGLEDPPEFHECITLLILVYPYFVKTHSHVERWRPLLLKALLPSQDIRDNELQIQLYRLMGETALLEGNGDFARRSFQIAFKRAEEKQVMEMIVATMAGLLKLQWFDIGSQLNAELIRSTLTISSQLMNKSLRAELYEALAYAYVRIGETVQGLGYAQLAYVFRFLTGDTTEIGLGAWILSLAYLRAASNHNSRPCLKNAEQFLEIAQACLAKSEYAWQYTLLTYEQGHIHLELEDYDEAEQCFAEALSEALRLQRPQYVVIAYHSLGLTQAKMAHYDEALKNLNAALEIWSSLHNLYEYANCLHALGDLEKRAGNTDAARQHLLDALSICKILPEVAQRKHLEKLINETMNEL